MRRLAFSAAHPPGNGFRAARTRANPAVNAWEAQVVHGRESMEPLERLHRYIDPTPSPWRRGYCRPQDMADEATADEDHQMFLDLLRRDPTPARPSGGAPKEMEQRAASYLKGVVNKLGIMGRRARERGSR